MRSEATDQSDGPRRARPIFCDLASSAAAVLERNVSAMIAADYERSASANSWPPGSSDCVIERRNWMNL